jgi:anthranilate 1,2-dioxygenase small subunit
LREGSRSIDAELRRRVEDLLGDCAQAIDDDALERWPDFFTEDAFYQIIAREGFEAGQPIGILSCTGRGMMRDRIAALRTANIYEPHTYCHVMGRASLIVAADGAIDARTNFALYRTMQGQSTELFAAGKYLDRITWESGVPRIRSRHAVLESRRVDILIVLPI